MTLGVRVVTFEAQGRSVRGDLTKRRAGNVFLFAVTSLPLKRPRVMRRANSREIAIAHRTGVVARRIESSVALRSGTSRSVEDAASRSQVFCEGQKAPAVMHYQLFLSDGARMYELRLEVPSDQLDPEAPTLRSVLDSFRVGGPERLGGELVRGLAGRNGS